MLNHMSSNFKNCGPPPQLVYICIPRLTQRSYSDLHLRKIWSFALHCEPQYCKSQKTWILFESLHSVLTGSLLSSGCLIHAGFQPLMRGSTHPVEMVVFSLLSSQFPNNRLLSKRQCDIWSLDWKSWNPHLLPSSATGLLCGLGQVPYYVCTSVCSSIE